MADSRHPGDKDRGTWAKWQGDSKYDQKDSRSSKTPDSGKRRGYQEARRIDRDRRDRRGEQKSDVKDSPGGSSKSGDGSGRGDGASDARAKDRSGYRGKGDYAGDKRDTTYGKSSSSRSDRDGAKSRSSDSRGKSRAEAEKTKKEDEEKAKKEAEEQKKLEEKKKEEERIRAEEEKKRREEEEAQRQLEEEKKSIEDFICETKVRNEERTSMREINLNAAQNRPEESFFERKDSSLKKNTAFVKKLKSITEGQKESLSKDFNSLNLTKYIGEAATSITENKLKMSDVGCALHLCSLMHQRYTEFSTLLLESWNKVLLNKKDEKVPNPSKLRVDLRFFADLVAIGVFTEKIGLPILANQLMLLITNDKESHHNLSIIISFCKHCGDDYAGLVPAKYSKLAGKYNLTITHSTLLPVERRKGCRNLLKDYFNSLCKHLVKDHQELRDMEKQNRKILQTKGELSSERKEKYESALNNYQKLLQNSNIFSDLLDEPLPDLPEDEIKTDESGGIDIYSPMRDSDCDYDGDTTLFEDEDTRQFYENLPDLKAIIPQILYKDSVQANAEPMETETQATVDEEMNLEDLEREIAAEADKSAADKSIDKVEEEPVDDIDEPEEDDFDIGASMKQILESFLTTLPNCVNRELIDKAATDFCMNLNTKANRKKLVKTIFTVQRTRYDLLPFYSRFIASLSPIMPDVSTDLVSRLKRDFNWHVGKKDQINIESKIKTVRFIGELVKFKIFPKVDAMFSLKKLMFDFSHHNIEMACALVETCGRFLYRSPDSHYMAKAYLDVMMRKKTALHLDSRYTTMIENAYYYSNPPDVKQEAKKVLPPMYQYIHKLLYRDLSKTTVERVLKQMRKLNWDDKDVNLFAIKCLAANWNVRYSTIHCCANLLSGLAPYHEREALQVVDAVLEEIRIGMEINHPKFNQRRVSCTKYLGELYNYRMVESSVVFKTMYSFISYAVSLDELQPSPLDPAEHLFRVRLVCVLLDTCGQYFDRGSSRKKLDCFLVYFLRYYWFKKKNPIWDDNRPFPMDIEYTVRDTLETLRPKMTYPETFEDAYEAADKLDKEFRAKIAELLPQSGTGNSEFVEPAPGDTSLTTIHESDEIEDLSNSLSQVRLEDERDSQSQDSDAVQQTVSNSHSHSQSLSQSQNAENAEDSSELSDTGSDMGDDDDVHLLTGGPKHIKCSEDDDFMTAFDKMMTDTVSARNQESLKVPNVDIAVPMQIKGQKARTPSVTGVVPGTMVPTTDEFEEEDKDANTINFVLMTKKGNKQQFTNLNVPCTNEFAARHREKVAAAKEEKNQMKRMVLDIHERQEEEDYQEQLAQMSRPALVNTNRERRIRYNHPKGAPDADLIFGSNKKR